MEERRTQPRSNELASPISRLKSITRSVNKFRRRRRFLKCATDGIRVSCLEHLTNEDTDGIFVTFQEIYAVHVTSRTVRRTLFTGQQRTIYMLSVHACISPNSSEPTNVRERRTETFTFEIGTKEEAQQLLHELRERVETSHEYALRPSQRRLLILINPFAGRKNAQSIYEHVVKPMLALANIDQVTCLTTCYDGHAIELIASCENLLTYTDIVSIGGDGVFHEILNGLLRRPDAEDAVKIALSVIPTGSGNALAVSLGIANVYSATWNLIKRFIRPMDLLAITQGAKSYYSFIFVAWAFLADVDLESDDYRWFGPARFNAAAFMRLIRLRRYRARLYYLESDMMEHTHNHDVNNNNTGEDTDNRRDPLDHGHSETFPQKPKTSYVGYGTLKRPSLELQECRKHFESTWKSANNDIFTFFAALNVPYVSSDGYLAPLANFQDGAIDLCFTGDHTFLELLTLFVKTDHGGQLYCPIYNYHHVKAFYLEPLGSLKDPHIVGSLDVDGERRPTEPCLVECLPRVVTLSCPYDV
jgi:diacylglycerol kinase family enzyme